MTDDPRDELAPPLPPAWRTLAGAPHRPSPTGDPKEVPMIPDINRKVEKFSRKFGRLLGSGVPLVLSLATIADECDDPALADALRHITEEVKGGRRFSESLELHPAWFSRSYVNMVRGAENQGVLDEAMIRIADALAEGSIEAGAAARPPRIEIADATLEMNRIISEAIDEGASDIHLFPARDELVVRYRIDGRLHEQKRLPRPWTRALSARVKIMAACDPAEERLPQDGRIMVKVKERTVDIRVAVLPTVVGEKVTMRILHPENVTLEPERIFPDPDDLAEFRRIAALPYGFVPFCGPTGSGKTTTVYCALAELAKAGDVAVYTVEDGVEYLLPNTVQIMPNAKIGLDIAAAAVSVMRHDPDVLFVSEIRDEMSLGVCLKAAVTGHLVFAQLHTADVADTLLRLASMEVPRHLTASALAGVVNQRLVRRLCPHCAKPAASAAGATALGLPDDPSGLREPVGCDRCAQTGYKGRTAIYEFLKPDRALKDALMAGDPAAIRAALSACPYRRFRESLARLVATGATSLPEALRVLEGAW